MPVASGEWVQPRLEVPIWLLRYFLLFQDLAISISTSLMQVWNVLYDPLDFPDSVRAKRLVFSHLDRLICSISSTSVRYP